MNPKIVKFVAKNALGGIFALAIGYAIKLEKKIEERIDDHYAESQDEKND
jgi:hypothetical protein